MTKVVIHLCKNEILTGNSCAIISTLTWSPHMMCPAHLNRTALGGEKQKNDFWYNDTGYIYANM